MLIRLICFGVLCVVALITPFPFFLFASLLYVLFTPGYELLLIAMFVDTVFGVHGYGVLYTLGVGGILAFSVIMKPHLSWYSQHTV
jgi:hypothetical protein